MLLHRSHCLLIVHAATTDQATGVRTVGKLTLCDLAGSERINKTGATGNLLLMSSAVLCTNEGCRALCSRLFPTSSEHEAFLKTPKYTAPWRSCVAFVF